MHKKELELFVWVLMLLVIFAITAYFPTYKEFHGDEYKDSDGNYYLAKYDSHTYLKGIKDHNLKDMLTFFGSGIYRASGIKGLYWFSILILMLSVIVFYAIAREFFPLMPSVFATLFFALHSATWEANLKGAFDTNGLILLFELCILGALVMFVGGKHKKWQSILLFLVSVLYLKWTWAGYKIFLFYTIVALIIVIIFKYRKNSFEIFPRQNLFLCFLVPIAIVVVSFIQIILISNWYGSSKMIVKQLQMYNFSFPFDMFLLPLFTLGVLFLVMHYFGHGGGNGKYCITPKMSLIFTGFIMYGSLGFMMLRFYYLFMPFYALFLGYVLFMISKKPKGKLHAFYFGSLIIFLVMLFTIPYINRPAIIMEDSIKEAMDLVSEQGCEHLMGGWDYGNMYYAYSNKNVISKAYPGYFVEFSTLLLSVPDVASLLIVPNSCYVVNSHDLRIMGVRSRISGIPISNESFFHNLTVEYDNAYFEFLGVYKGNVTDLWVWKGKV